MGREEGGRKMRGAGKGAGGTELQERMTHSLGWILRSSLHSKQIIITTLRAPRPRLALQNMTGRCCVSLNIVCCLIAISRPWWIYFHQWMRPFYFHLWPAFRAFSLSWVLHWLWLPVELSPSYRPLSTEGSSLIEGWHGPIRTQCG